jgi:transposase-like protein
MGRQRARRYPDELKVAAVSRMQAGERVRALAAELGIKPQVLYRWWNNVEFAGAVTLRPGRPARAAEGARSAIAPRAKADDGAAGPRRRGKPPAAPAAVPPEAAKRIAELERTVGQQALELDFFAAALRHLEAPRPTSGRGARTPSPSSER